MASQIAGVPIVCSIVCSGADQRKHQSSASLAFVRAIHRWPVNSPHKRPATRKMFPFDDVPMFVVHTSELHETSKFDGVKGMKYEFACWHVEKEASRGQNGQIHDSRQKLALTLKTIDFNENVQYITEKNIVKLS